MNGATTLAKPAQAAELAHGGANRSDEVGEHGHSYHPNQITSPVHAMRRTSTDAA
jgi:hypothetical protein